MKPAAHGPGRKAIIRSFAASITAAFLIGGIPPANARADLILAGTFDGVNHSGNGIVVGYESGFQHTNAYAVQLTIGGQGLFTAESVTASLKTMISKTSPPPDPTKFSIYLRADSGGRPGIDLSSFALNSSVTTTYNSVSYSFTTPATVVGGQIYWLTLEANTTMPTNQGDYGIAWSNQLSGANGTLATRVSTSNVPPSGTWLMPFSEQNMAFQLRGTATVPEPGSLLLVSTALIGSLFYRRTTS